MSYGGSWEQANFIFHAIPPYQFDVQTTQIISLLKPNHQSRILETNLMLIRRVKDDLRNFEA
jgi:hypothetical protein